MFIPRSALRNAAEYPPGPAPRTSISHSTSALPEYVLAAGADAVVLPLPLAGEGWGEGALAGEGWGGGAPAEEGRGEGATPAASSVATSVPSATLSPTLTLTAAIFPAAGDGTSIVALSDSSVTSGSSTLTTSPGLTWTSMTGTSLKSPMSGTLISIVLMCEFPFSQ